MLTVEERILSLLASLSSRVPADIIDRARAEVEYGEYGVAFESLCENVFEVDARLTRSHLREFEDLAAHLGIEDERWDFVRSLEEWPEDAES